MSDYPTGPVINNATAAHPDGSLLQDNKTIWWLRFGKRIGFESMTVFNTYGFSLSRVVKSNKADLAIKEGYPVRLRDGTLVLDHGTYFIISDGKKYAFTNEAQLVKFGYKLSNVVFADLGGMNMVGSLASSLMERRRLPPFHDLSSSPVCVFKPRGTRMILKL